MNKKENIVQPVEKSVQEVMEERLQDVYSWDIKAIEEIVFIEQIETGINEEENFYEALSEHGLPYKKKGRIPWNEFVNVAPVLVEDLKCTDPRARIKDILGLKTKEGLEKMNRFIDASRKVKARDKEAKKERNSAIHEESMALSHLGVKFNKGLLWSVYYIQRGKLRIERIEENGGDWDLLYAQYECVDEETIKLLFDLRKEYYDDDD